jgi:hypothetical protein
MIPAIVTSPWASMNTGVFAGLPRKVTVTPDRMFTVV